LIADNMISANTMQMPSRGTIITASMPQACALIGRRRLDQGKGDAPSFLGLASHSRNSVFASRLRAVFTFRTDEDRSNRWTPTWVFKPVVAVPIAFKS
jgi:hypothetical protein